MKKFSFIFISSLLFPLIASATTLSFQKIVDTSTLIPSGHGTFRYLDAPYLHDSKIVFRGFGDKRQAGIYTNLNNHLQMVANTQTTIPRGAGEFIDFGIPQPPNRSEYVRYHYLAYNSPALDDNAVVFTATGPHQQAGNYLYTNNHLELIADKNTKIPGGQGNFQQFGSPYLSAGKIAFNAIGGNAQQGIYVFSQQNLQMLYNTLTPIPGGHSTFKVFWNPDFDGGFSTFRGTGADKQIGVYDDVDGKLENIADLNTSIPDGQGKFISLGAPSLQNGHVAFRGSGRLDQSGIYSDFSGKLQAIVTLKSTIPNGDGQFSGVFNPTIDANNIVFTGTGGHNQQGIYLFYGGQLLKIISNADKLDGQKIKTLDLGAVSLSKNQVAFHVVFADNTQAIYLATIS